MYPNKLTVLAACLVVFFFSSCEHEARLVYKINNSCSEPIKVICTNTDNGLRKNDTFNIAAGSETTIASMGQGLGGVNEYKEALDTLRKFPRMDIYKHDTILAHTDFRKTSRWLYHEQTVHIGEYVLTVMDADF